MASSVQNNRVSSPGYCVCCRTCNMWCWRAFKWLPVLLIVSIITWSYYAYVIQLCIFTIESTVQQCIYLVLYHILLIMFAWSYWRTIFAEIKPIPETFKLPEAELEKLLSAETEDAQRSILDNYAKDLPIVTRIVEYVRKLVAQIVPPETKKEIIENFANTMPVLTRNNSRIRNYVTYGAAALCHLLRLSSYVVCMHSSHDSSWIARLTQRTMSGSVRYCNRCVLIKPDRAHHCSICARCVLKMDHHCPWVNNCVCFFNYKFFMLFLGYALFYCIFIMATCLPYFIKFWKMYEEYKYAHCDRLIQKGSVSKICMEMINGDFGAAASAGRYHIVFAFFVALMFAISLGSLFGYHCYLVINNRTTLEAFRAPMFRGGADKNGFSIGAFNNFKEVFGNSPNLWLVPVFTSLGDGCEFPVRREHQLQTFTTAQETHGYESMGTTRSRSDAKEEHNLATANHIP